MTGEDEWDCDVLVVGLGPVGAVLATLLVQSGMRVMAIDKDSAVYPLPRAAHFDHEIMRLFQQLGIADAVLPHARVAPAYEFRSAEGEVLLRYELGRSSPSGWASSYMFHQPAVETALRAKLASSPLARISLERTFRSLQRIDGGVRVSLDGTDGASHVTARYVVGCDGASSAVRAALGIELHDYAFDEPWLVIDVVAGEGAVLPDVNLQICDPARPTTCVLMGPGRHRWEFMLLPGESPDTMLSDSVIAKLLEPWGCADTVTVDRKAVYRFHGLIAKQWRQDRVLLAGDAAHQMPPFAGQGMCSGLRDAANLAWKLAAVISGEANDSILDTYQSEREPHLRAILESAIAMGRIVCTLNPNVAAQRDQAMLAERASGRTPIRLAVQPLGPGLTCSGATDAGEQFPQFVVEQNATKLYFDDALPRGAWLITETAVAPDWAPHPMISWFTLSDPRLLPYAEELRNWLGARAARAVLIRPDRYIFGTGDAAHLAREFQGALATA
jgi:3-(3-hydroxy-phenyl)propionate hydroxylase